MKEDMEILGPAGTLTLTETGLRNLALYRLLNSVEANYGGYGFISDGRPR